MFGFFSELVKIAGLPIDEIIKEYKVVFLGSGGVIVSNYIKILTYNNCKLVLKVKDNVLNIEGVSIKIQELSKGEILAKGKINKIYLSREYENLKENGGEN